MGSTASFELSGLAALGHSSRTFEGELALKEQGLELKSAFFCESNTLNTGLSFLNGRPDGGKVRNM